MIVFDTNRQISYSVVCEHIDRNNKEAARVFDQFFFVRPRVIPGTVIMCGMFATPYRLGSCQDYIEVQSSRNIQTNKTTMVYQELWWMSIECNELHVFKVFCLYAMTILF